MVFQVVAAPARQRPSFTPKTTSQKIIAADPSSGVARDDQPLANESSGGYSRHDGEEIKHTGRPGYETWRHFFHSPKRYGRRHAEVPFLSTRPRRTQRQCRNATGIP